MTTIEILDQDQARVWQAEVERLNEETARLLSEVGMTLQDVREDAESPVVDELYHWGSQMIAASSEILRGMNELTAAISDILKRVDEVMETGRDTVRDIVRSIGDFGG